jgi:D-sedoheptulose 7-phosphate isomerase
MRDRAESRFAEHARVAQAMLEPSYCEAAERFARTIVGAFQTGGKLLLFGNGGSAADAQHVAGELSGRYLFDRHALPAMALADSIAAVTAIGNDYGFEHVFERQLRAFGRSGDVALGLSTSGRSPNVLAGVRTARELGMQTLAVSGEDGGPLAELADDCVRIPAAETPQIQEGTMVFLHTVCELVEHELFGG